MVDLGKDMHKWCPLPVSWLYGSISVWTISCSVPIWIGAILPKPKAFDHATGTEEKGLEVFLGHPG